MDWEGCSDGNPAPFPLAVRPSRDPATSRGLRSCPHRCPAFSHPRRPAPRPPPRRRAGDRGAGGGSGRQSPSASRVVEPNRTGAGTGAPSPAGSDLAYTTILPETGGVRSSDRALAAASNLADLQDEPPPSAFGLIRRGGRGSGAPPGSRPCAGLVGRGGGGRLVRLAFDGIELPQRIRNRAAEPGRVGRVDRAGARLQHRHGGSGRLPRMVTWRALPVDVDQVGAGRRCRDPARAEAMVRAQRAGLIDRWDRTGTLLSPENRRGRSMSTTRSGRMEITFALEPRSAGGGWGRSTMTGLERTDADFPAPSRAVRAWAPALLFFAGADRQLRRDLASLGLFQFVRVGARRQPERGRPAAADRPGWRSGRPGSSGSSCATRPTIGFGGRATWGHRNLFGAAERLRLGVEIAASPAATTRTTMSAPRRASPSPTCWRSTRT